MHISWMAISASCLAVHASSETKISTSHYPRNFDDADLTSLETPDVLPLHGNLEAFLAHAGLAKLLARNSDLLYPLEPLEAEQIFSRTTDMLDAMAGWRSLLPGFLTPREKTLAGHKMFERQNTGASPKPVPAARSCISNYVSHQTSGVAECILNDFNSHNTILNDFKQWWAAATHR